MKTPSITYLLLLFFCYTSLEAGEPHNPFGNDNKIITATKRIHLPAHPGAYNPSIVKFNDYYLLSYRYAPSRYFQPFLSYTGVILLDSSFEPISHSQLLDTRFKNKATYSQCEDARIISHNGKVYLFYNDNMEINQPTVNDRRDMYVSELIYIHDQFLLSDPIKLTHADKLNSVLWQKNWTPFIWNNLLFLTYSIDPHEILYPDLKTGSCETAYETQKHIPWNYGSLRGGTPSLLIDGEYLSFFHSANYTNSHSSDGRSMWHYYMGAYTFSADPPFEINKVSASAIDHTGFYTYSSYEKRVIYPGGFVHDGSKIHLAYGKDDCEVWIATIDLKELKKSMIPLQPLDKEDK